MLGWVAGDGCKCECLAVWPGLGEATRGRACCLVAAGVGTVPHRLIGIFGLLEMDHDTLKLSFSARRLSAARIWEGKDAFFRRVAEPEDFCLAGAGGLLFSSRRAIFQGGVFFEPAHKTLQHCAVTLLAQGFFTQSFLSATYRYQGDHLRFSD